jgi:hypothetical protein
MRALRRHAFAALAAGASLPAPGAAQEAATISVTVGKLVDSLRLYAEGASRLTFRRPPRFAVQDRRQVQAYVEREFDRPGTAERVRSQTVAYFLFGLMPDTLVRRREMIEAHAALLRGYYDPETDTLYIVAGQPRNALAEVVSHELVHALQDQQIDLATLPDGLPDDDARLAARMVVEGQATFASLRLLVGGRNIVGYTGLWREIVRVMKLDPSLHPSFKRIPLVMRENLIGPYVYGAEFMSWWQGWQFADSAPFGVHMPRSTEQVLHPARYASGDEPVRLAFADSGGGVIAEGVLGELQIHLVAAQLAGASRLEHLRPLGWAGDRYRVYASAAGPALVWYVAWDEPEAAAAFAGGLGRQLAARRRTGYRARLDTLTVDGRAAARYIFAPTGWERWDTPPALGAALTPARD